MIGHLLGAAGAVEAIAAIQVNWFSIMRYGYLFILTQIEAHKENGGGKGHFNSCTHDKYGYDIYKLPKQMNSFISFFFLFIINTLLILPWEKEHWNCTSQGTIVELFLLPKLRTSFSSVLDVVFCYFVQAIRTGWVHPNINLENPDQGVVCSLLCFSRLLLWHCRFICDVHLMLLKIKFRTRVY
jgi:hypothetical protein